MEAFGERKEGATEAISPDRFSFRFADNTYRIAALRANERRKTSSDALSDKPSGLRTDSHRRSHLSVLFHPENAQNSSRA